MSNDEKTRRENMPLWAVEEFDDLYRRFDKLIEQVEAMLADSLEQFSNRLDACVAALRDTVEREGEATRTNSAKLAGQIHGAIYAARSAANEVLQVREHITGVRKDVRVIQHRVESLELGGEKLYKNGGAGGNGAER